jgi:succinoglycan biosynthesis protein ExoL
MSSAAVVSARLPPRANDVAATGERRPRLAYFVHDLQDTAVLRRVRMLEAGGADVVVFGFSREAAAPQRVGEAAVVCLGRTRPRRFVARIASVILALAKHRRWIGSLAAADAVVARNLECLALAVFARARRGERVPLHYEVLDVHRLMLREDAVGTVLRAIESRLMRGSESILVSSPAFATHYFDRFHASAPVRCQLIENKVFPLPAGEPARAAANDAAGPIVIGWCGVLRCRRSLLLLGELTQRFPGRYRVVMRGKVADSAIPDFHELLRGKSDLHYLGPYRYPDDLPSIYGAIDLAWAIDFFEAGMNSAWLLPNRLYESGLYGAVALALDGVQTGDWLRARSLGVTLAGRSNDELIAAIAAIPRESIENVRRSVRSAPRSLFGADRAECAALVEALVA